MGAQVEVGPDGYLARLVKAGYLMGVNFLPAAVKQRCVNVSRVVWIRRHRAHHRTDAIVIISIRAGIVSFDTGGVGVARNVFADGAQHRPWTRGAGGALDLEP